MVGGIMDLWDSSIKGLKNLLKEIIERAKNKPR